MTRYLSPEALRRALPVPVKRDGEPRAGFVATRETGEPAATLFLAATRGDLTLYHLNRKAFWDLEQVRVFVAGRTGGRRKKR